MRCLLTGLNGTLAPKVAAAAARRAWQVTGWDRARVPTHDADAGRAFLEQAKPDAVLHLAMGDEGWAGRLAAWAGQRRIPFIFTSTAMVFDHQPDGPHAPHDARTAKDDYGRSKIRCEDAVLAANPAASVVRIGWQIDADARGNNMLAHLDEAQRREGCLKVSTGWRPACSFMEDTAELLLRLVEAPTPGALHADSNAVEAHTFDRVVTALRQWANRDHWVLAPNEDYRHDQRLIGGLAMPPLSARLPGLCADVRG